MYIVYFLVDPNVVDHIRYVGYSSKSPAYRLSRHIQEAIKTKKDTYKLHWIRHLLAHNRQPQIIVASRFEIIEEAKLYERELISWYRKNGHSLTNTTDGGDGGGNKWSISSRLLKSEQARAQMTLDARKHLSDVVQAQMTPERRQQIADSLRGKALQASHRKNISEGLQAYYSTHKRAPRTEEHRRKLGAAHIGKTPWNKGLKRCASPTEN